MTAYFVTGGSGFVVGAEPVMGDLPGDAPWMTSDCDSVKRLCQPPGVSREPADARRKILDASIELVAEQGVRAVSFREVARRAGGSHQTPYHHFGDHSRDGSRMSKGVEHNVGRRVFLAKAAGAALVAWSSAPSDAVPGSGQCASDATAGAMSKRMATAI